MKMGSPGRKRVWYAQTFSRFATEEYTTDIEQAGNNFIHLTNFSLNKNSEKFVHNSDPEKAEVNKNAI